MYDIIGLVLRKVRQQYNISIPDEVIYLVRRQYCLILLQRRKGWPYYNNMIQVSTSGDYSYACFDAFREIMDVSKWEHKHIMQYNNISYQYAVVNKHIPILQHLLDIREKYQLSFTIKNVIDCAFHGSVSVLEYLYKYYPEEFAQRIRSGDPVGGRADHRGRRRRRI